MESNSEVVNMVVDAGAGILRRGWCFCRGLLWVKGREEVPDWRPEFVRGAPVDLLHPGGAWHVRLEDERVVGRRLLREDLRRVGAECCWRACRVVPSGVPRHRQSRLAVARVDGPGEVGAAH